MGKLKCEIRVMKFKKKNCKKGGQKKQIHRDEVKKKKKVNTGGEFCRLEEF